MLFGIYAGIIFWGVHFSNVDSADSVDIYDMYVNYTLPETNSLHLKMAAWKMNFLLGAGLFSEFLLLVSGSVFFSMTSWWLKKYERFNNFLDHKENV